MGLLDKFLGDGKTYDMFGNVKGRVEHRSENLAHRYNEYGEYLGRIETYGDVVYEYDAEGNYVGRGDYYDKSDTISMTDANGQLISEVSYRDGKSYDTSIFSTEPTTEYSISDWTDEDYNIWDDDN